MCSNTSSPIEYYEEPSTSGVIHKFSYKKTYYKEKSNYQLVEIVKSEAYGKILVLDSQIQSSSVDEFIYHESLVHPAMLSHPNPKKVFIGGGGEGATAREVLKYDSVEECVMVDIDPLVCESAKRFLKKWHCGAFEDSRLLLIVADAKTILENYPNEHFDVIILDLSDPLDFGPCYKLYSTEFYSLCLGKLSKTGIFVTQSGPSSFHVCTEIFTPIYKTLTTVFPYVYPYVSHIPSFANVWAFQLAHKTNCSSLNFVHDPNSSEYSIKKINESIVQTISHVKLKHFDGLCHQHMFTLPKYLRFHLEKEERIICEKTPIYVSHVSSDFK